MSGDREWRSVFEESYAAPPSEVAERVWRGVFGDEYPAGLDPFSYISTTELERFSTEVRLGAGAVVADLGCGRGGPGLWVAMATGSRLIGVDIAEHALEAARERSRSLGFDMQARFVRGSFEDTGLGDGEVNAVMSVDAFLFAPDKAAAAREFHRILAPGGRLVFTSWDYHRQPKGRPPQVDDHRPLLSNAGFDVLAYEETDDWRRRISETSAGLLEHVMELAAESGEPVEKLQDELLEMEATIETMSRRVLVVAEAH